MRKVLIFLIAVMVGFSQPVQAQNVVDEFGVKHWVGGGGWGGWGDFSLTKKTKPSLTNEIKWWGAIAGGVGSLVYHEYNKAKMSREMYEAAEKLAKLGMVEITPTSVRLTPTGIATAQKLGYSVDGYSVSQVRIEDWNGRDWGSKYLYDPRINGYVRKADLGQEEAEWLRNLWEDCEDEADSKNPGIIKECMKNKIVKDKFRIRQIKEERKSLQEKLSSKEPDTLLQKSPNGVSPKPKKEELIIEEIIIPQSSKRVPLPDAEKAKPEGTFNWQPVSPESSKVVLAGLTLEEQKFFGNDEGLVVRETFTPPAPQRKVFQKEGDYWVKAK